MADSLRNLVVYLHLARASDLRRQPMVTDKLLVLAGATAVEMAIGDIADRCFAAVRERNPQHLLRNWTGFGEVYPAERFQTYLKQLRRQYSPEKAEHMLQSLGIVMARESELYASDHEYVSALVDVVARR